MERDYANLKSPFVKTDYYRENKCSITCAERLISAVFGYRC